MWNFDWKYWRAVEVLKRTPIHYQKYLYDLQHKPPKPVHFIPKDKLYTRNHITGEIRRYENRVIPLIFPKQSNQGLWGGEGIMKGIKKGPKHKDVRIPKYWFPTLRRAVIYSEILDKRMKFVVTLRALNLIDQAYGFDYYILKTDPVDLRSQLAMDFRRKMLLTLVRKEMYPNDEKKREEIFEKYKEFIIPEEEAEWVGLSIMHAVIKQMDIERKQNEIKPLKMQYRIEYFEELKKQVGKGELVDQSISTTWLSKMKSFRPFK